MCLGAYRIYVLITPLNVHADISSRARGLNFGQSSSTSLRRLARTVVAQQCHKYQTLTVEVLMEMQKEFSVPHQYVSTVI